MIDSGYVVDTQSANKPIAPLQRRVDEFDQRSSIYEINSSPTRISYDTILNRWVNSTGNPLGGFIASINRPILSCLEDRIKHIERIFALNTKQLADALLVSRRTVYNWRDQSSSPQDTNLSRIEFLMRIASEYYKKEPVNRTGKLKVVIDGQSLLDLITNENALETEIFRFINKLSAKQGVADREKTNSYAVNALRRKKKASIPLSFPIYGTDANYPGMIIETHANGQKIVGKIINGKFVVS